MLKMTQRGKWGWVPRIGKTYAERFYNWHRIHMIMKWFPKRNLFNLHYNRCPKKDQSFCSHCLLLILLLDHHLIPQRLGIQNRFLWELRRQIDPVFCFIPICDDFLEHPVHCGHDNKQVCHTSTSHTNIIMPSFLWPSLVHQVAKSLQKHLASSPTLYISHWHWIQIDSDLLPQRISVGELLKRMIHHAMCVLACSSIRTIYMELNKCRYTNVRGILRK